MRQTNNFILRTSCKGTVSKLYTRKTLLLLGSENQQQVIILPTRTILYPCLYVMSVKYVHNISKSICNRNNEK